MSRECFNNEQYQLVVGVDRLTSSFIQVWHQPAEEQDFPILIIDNMGVQEDLEVPNELKTLVEETKDRFKRSREKGNLYPNLDAATIFRFADKLGFNQDIHLKIYSILD